MWITIDWKTEQLDCSLVEVLVRWHEATQCYTFTIAGTKSTATFDTLNDAKRVAIASLRNKLTAMLANLPH